MPLAGEGRIEKRFRVAREGQTVDGRELTRQEIQEMAASYNPEHYAGRINIEHFSGWSPEPPFNAYGDIIKVEAVEEDGKFSLYNTISALPNFVAMNKNGQKIYPSIEFYRNFAGTGKAYQVGLGMTDQPASLGTQAIKFSSQQFTCRTQPNTEIFITMSEQTTQPEQKGMLEQLRTLLTPAPKPAEEPDFKEVVTQGLVTALNSIAELNQKIAALSQQQQTPAVVNVAPVTQPTPATTEQAAAQDQLSQALQPILQSIQSMQTQITQLSTTAVNAVPPAPGGDVDKVDY
ncbi:GPO family capsid scaffolding protein [Acinetobacter piscicola]|uniref:GPO family capsid scaffolding protein n=1 Tax=Acinetobacter piscicola TaxID=2006115 RepID=UPI00101F727C|nr:GPO family capsid scaffolding protein [Acinetobacter piscicola]RYL25902.1 capsid scaffolding protein [Acinetobacter piscicola]